MERKHSTFARAESTHTAAGMLARVPEFVIILLAGMIIFLAGFSPLFDSRHRVDLARQECEMFYGHGGPSWVAHCVTEMAERSARVARQP
jgi:hypothetical protein